MVHVTVIVIALFNIALEKLAYLYVQMAHIQIILMLPAKLAILYVQLALADLLIAQAALMHSFIIIPACLNVQLVYLPLIAPVSLAPQLLQVVLNL